jgi:hypothetical protein
MVPTLRDVQVKREQYKELALDVAQQRRIKHAGLQQQLGHRTLLSVAGWIGVRMEKWGLQLQGVGTEPPAQHVAFKTTDQGYSKESGVA